MRRVLGMTLRSAMVCAFICLSCLAARCAQNAPTTTAAAERREPLGPAPADAEPRAEPVQPSPRPLEAAEVEERARATEAIRAFLDRYGTCDGCTISDAPGAPPRIGCVSYQVSRGCATGEACDGEQRWVVEYWVGPVCSFRYGTSQVRVSVEVDGRSGEVLGISPPPAFIIDGAHCEQDSDCQCLSGSGVPFLGCANKVHAPLHFAGSYSCDACTCVQGRCQ
jgi:hypothetical protein